MIGIEYAPIYKAIIVASTKDSVIAITGIKCTRTLIYKTISHTNTTDIVVAITGTE